MPTEATRAKKILIVDDTEANTMLLEHLLEEFGFTDLMAINDSRETLDLCVKARPDLILLDIRMPYLDGFDVMKQLEERLGDKRPPIIVLTAQTDAHTKARAIALGARDFLNKPFECEDVINSIERVFEASAEFPLPICHDDLRKLSSLFEGSDADLSNVLEQLILTDPLTGVPNRRALQKIAIEAFVERRSLTAFYILIDGIGAQAHLHGHQMTDEAFNVMIGRLRKSPLAQNMSFGVWSGTHIVALCTNCPEAKDALRAAKLIKAQLDGHYRLGNSGFYAKARIGFCGSRKPLGRPDEVIRRAMLAVPKRTSDTEIQGYNETLDQKIIRRAMIEGELRNAIRKDELSLVFQPKICLRTGKTAGVEALLRWTSGKAGPIGPDEFIPIAEQNGIIDELGIWVTWSALEQMSRWYDQHQLDDTFKMAINVSTMQLRNDGYRHALSEFIENFGINPRHIELEVTETSFVDDFDRISCELKALRAMGISIALDDFGTGYSSLAYLQNFPFDTLKIDRAFLQTFPADDRSEKLVSAVVLLADAFNLQVVAEGIEEGLQADALTSLGCAYGQGYHFSKPRPASDVFTPHAMLQVS